MRILIVSGTPGSAIDNCMQPVARVLRTILHDGEIEVVPYDKVPESLEGYDVLHYGFFNMPRLKAEEDWEGVRTANVWHIPIASASKYFNILSLASFDGHVVDDTTTFQILGQMGIQPTLIPMILDLSKFPPLPIPEGPFTVGYFGSDFPHKRFETIRLACQKASVECLLFVTHRMRAHFELSPIEDVYAHIHVLAHASYLDVNSQPVREALRCGRPVIATHGPTLSQLIDGCNGTLTDGSVEEIADAIGWIKADYESYRRHALETLPTEDREHYRVAVQYFNLFERLLERKK